MFIIGRKIAYLHTHTVHSEKDGSATCKDYVKKIRQYNKDAGEEVITGLAITEHGNMFSMVKHYQACTTSDNKEPNVKPILGCEVYHCVDRGIENEDRFHLVLLAKNDEGLKNLYQIVSDAGLHKVKGRSKDFPTTHEPIFEEFGKGIIASTACIGGIIPKLILNGEYEKAKEKALYYNSIFEHFYLEVQPNEMPEQLLVNSDLVKMSQETGIELIITCDAHYVELADKKYHDVLKIMAHQKPFSCDVSLMMPNDLETYCNKHNIPLSCMDNTVKIAEMCVADPRPKDERGLLPPFPCPKGYSEEAYLREIAFDGLMDFISKKKIKDVKTYTNQMMYELDVICSMGFAGYFLILWDWFLWCRKNGILMGKGRGSAAGSVVSYCLSITTIDPIKNKFYFERFMNMERIEFPDIDSDISRADRARGIDYLLQKYGSEYVSQIITFSEYKLKNTIKSVMSAYEYSYEEANEMTKSLPDTIDGNAATYDLIMDVATNPDKYADLGPREIGDCQRSKTKLEEMFQKYPEVYDAVTHLKGCISGTGLHAGGVVIAGKILKENMPLMSGSDTAVLPVVQIEMNDLGFFNALKIDVLGLNTLTQIKSCMDLAGLDYDWYDSEDFDDPKVYEMLRKGETTDVFQMASFMATRMIQDMKVDSIEGLSAVNAGNRPGPLAKNKETNKSMVDLYIEAKNSGKIKAIHPKLDEILESTQGCMWFQEQLMKIGEVMAGYSLGMADLRIRKVLGKKLLEKIPEIRNEFVYGKQSIFDENHKVIGISEEDSPYCKGAIANGFDEQLALEIFDAMAEFAKYCFNAAHSGAYAAMAYKTAYLSLYHPVEWAVACLSTYDDTDKITATLTLCKKRGIKILPPDINKSEEGFTVEVLPTGEKAIRYGLLAIKDVGGRAIWLIKLLRTVGEFKGFDDFYDRVHNNNNVKILLIEPNTGKKQTNPCNKKAEVALINAGAFDEFEDNRYKMMNHFMQDVRAEKGYEILREADYCRKVKLALEKELMGSYISEHPLDPFPYADIESAANGDIVETTGIVKKVTIKNTKRGDKFANVVIETKDGKERKVMLFSRAYEKYKTRLKKDEVIVVIGEVNKEFSNINCTKVKKIVGKSTIMPSNDGDDGIEDLTTKDNQSNVVPFQMPIKADPLADMDYSPVDMLLQNYGG